MSGGSTTYNLTIKNASGTAIHERTGLTVEPDVKCDANGKPVAVWWIDTDGTDHKTALGDGWDAAVKTVTT